jgi:hypothetical protein
VKVVSLHKKYQSLISTKPVYEIAALSEDREATYARINKWNNQGLPKSISLLEKDLNILGYKLSILPIEDDLEIVQELAIHFRSYSSIYESMNDPLLCFSRAEKIAKLSKNNYSLSQIKKALEIVIKYWNTGK